MLNVISYTDIGLENVPPKISDKIHLETLLDGRSFFWFENIQELPSDLYHLVNGSSMFYSCSKLEKIDKRLPNLEIAQSMFQYCRSLKDVDTILPHLWGAPYMFGNCSALTSFNINLDQLVLSGAMFQNCEKLESFISDLSKLENAPLMFSGCKNLKTFVGNLASVNSASNMFDKCKLDALSVLHIIDSIAEATPDSPFSKITIGIDVSPNEKDGKSVEEQLLDFAKEMGYDTWNDVKDALTEKGWTAAWQFNDGSDIALLATDSLSLPIYARINKEIDKEMALYCSEDGKTYYNLEWGHDVSDVLKYKKFGSLSEACGYFNIIPKEFLENN